MPAPRPARWPWVVGVVLAAIAAYGARDLLQGRDAAPGEEGGAAARGAAVVAAPIERASMMVRRRYPGELFADAVEISSRIAGHVEAIDVRIGDVVEADAIVARLDDGVLRRQIEETKAQIRAQRSSAKSAEIAAKAARRDVERARGLADQGALSAQELDDLETALQQREADVATRDAQLDQAQARLQVLQKDVQDATIRAPFAGVVARRDVDPGAFVSPGSPLLRIVAQSPLRVRFRVPEYDLAGVAEGMPFVLETRAGEGEPSTGEVTRLSGEVSASDRSLSVEGMVDPGSTLRPGMYADVVLDVRPLEDVLVIPADAFIERVDGGGHTLAGVFVVAGDHARWVAVRVLGREGDRIAIAPTGEGVIGDGDRVLVRGHRELADGGAIRLSRAEAGGA